MTGGDLFAMRSDNFSIASILRPPPGWTEIVLGAYCNGGCVPAACAPDPAQEASQVRVEMVQDAVGPPEAVRLRVYVCRPELRLEIEAPAVQPPGLIFPQRG